MIAHWCATISGSCSPLELLPTRNQQQRPWPVRPTGQPRIGSEAARLPRFHHAVERLSRVAVQIDELRIGQIASKKGTRRAFLGSFRASERSPSAVVLAVLELTVEASLPTARRDRAKRRSPGSTIGQPAAMRGRQPGNVFDQAMDLVAGREQSRRFLERLVKQGRARSAACSRGRSADRSVAERSATAVRRVRAPADIPPRHLSSGEVRRSAAPRGWAACPRYKAVRALERIVRRLTVPISAEQARSAVPPLPTKPAMSARSPARSAHRPPDRRPRFRSATTRRPTAR